MDEISAIGELLRRDAMFVRGTGEMLAILAAQLIEPIESIYLESVEAGGSSKRLASTTSDLERLQSQLRKLSDDFDKAAAEIERLAK